MKKIEKAHRRVAPAGLALISAFVIGGIWAADGVYRLFREPEENSIYWKDDTGTNVVMEAETPEGQDLTVNTEGTLAMPIQDANASFTDPAQDVPEGYMTVPQDETGIHSGLLVQIDESHPYTGSTGELTTFAEKNDSYRMKRMDLSTRPEVVSAMNNMGSAYQSTIGAANLMVYSTIAPYEVAGSLYPNDLPDRSCGYCVDLCMLNEDGTISKLSEPNAWVKENGWKYGFVLSYPESDTGTTGVEYAPYHLRYVGKVHAGIMHEQNLTLSGYYAYLKNHTVSVPLYCTAGDTMYMVYYVPAASGMTEVPVPRNKEYEISGNNTDGYIVTVKN